MTFVVSFRLHNKEFTKETLRRVQRFNRPKSTSIYCYFVEVQVFIIQLEHNYGMSHASAITGAIGSQTECRQSCSLLAIQETRGEDKKLLQYPCLSFNRVLNDSCIPWFSDTRNTQQLRLSGLGKATDWHLPHHCSDGLHYWNQLIT